MEVKYQNAIEYYGMAADKGNIEAKYKLSRILVVEGLKLLGDSMKEGHKEALEFYPDLLMQIKGLEKYLPSKDEEFCRQEIKIGSIVKLGTYPADKYANRAPIAWVVLKLESGRALLHSKYALDAVDVDNLWKDHNLKTWLNDIFFNKAFAKEEQRKIISNYDAINHPNDRVFLLNCQEVCNLMPNKFSRRREMTLYTKERVAYADGNKWLLHSITNYYNRCIPSVKLKNGDIDIKGGTYKKICICPALWINIV